MKCSPTPRFQAILESDPRCAWNKKTARGSDFNRTMFSLDMIIHSNIDAVSGLHRNQAVARTEGSIGIGMRQRAVGIASNEISCSN